MKTELVKYSMRRLISIACLHVAGRLLAAFILFLPLYHYGQVALSTLNIDQFYQAVVTFTTGTMIALFLAVFYSDSKRIKIIRNMSGAVTIYYVVLIELLIIVMSSLVLLSDRSLVTCAILSLLIIFMFDLVWMIMKLIYLAFKEV